MRVGHAAVELPVPAGTPLGGYAARTGPSTGTGDRLEVSAVTLDGLTWVVADLPYVHEDVAAAVAARVPGPVWVSATHTHSGPETSCLPASPTTPAPWLSSVASAAAAASTAAAAAAGEARLEVRRVRLSGVGGQRSGARPRRTVPVDVLSFVDGAGSLAGLLVVLPVHPTVLGADNLLVSADLSGAARRALAGRLGGPWVVVATGAAGDVSTRPHRLAQTPQECARLGGLVADTVLRGLAGPPRAVAPAGAPVATASVRVPLEPKPPPGSPELIARLEDRLARARRSGSAVAERTAYTALQAAQLAATAPAPPDPACAVAVAGIGPVRLVALGAEPYLALAERLDGRLDAATVLVGYTNGYLGYLPIRAAYRRSDYEVLRSPVAAGSAEDVLDRAARMAADPVTHHRKDRP